MNSLNYACTYAFVYGTSALKKGVRKIKARTESVIHDESGMEIIAIVLILVVVIALAIIFRKFIAGFFNYIIDTIKHQIDPDKYPEPSWDFNEKINDGNGISGLVKKYDAPMS